MVLRYPGAKWDGIPGAGPFKGGPYRGVLHTTEGSSYAGARGAYLKSRVSPHFTIGAEGAWQHVDLNQASSALVNIIGGVETNRLSAIQIEVIGFAAQPGWPDQLVAAVRDLMAWIEVQTGIEPWAPPEWGANDAYGAKTRYRMAPDAWLNFNGWCGHQHVPENAHWDPGRIPINRLLERQEAPVADDAPPVYKVQTKIIAFHPTPTGKGYWIVTADGGIFSFGDAVYLGRLDAPVN